MKTKTKIILAYLVIAFIFAIYLSKFGPNQARGFAYAFGQSIVWPALIFPGIGQVIGAILIILFVAFIAFL